MFAEQCAFLSVRHEYLFWLIYHDNWVTLLESFNGKRPLTVCVSIKFFAFLQLILFECFFILPNTSGLIEVFLCITSLWAPKKQLKCNIKVFNSSQLVFAPNFTLKIPIATVTKSFIRPTSWMLILMANFLQVLDIFDQKRHTGRMKIANG